MTKPQEKILDHADHIHGLAAITQIVKANPDLLEIIRDCAWGSVYDSVALSVVHRGVGVTKVPPTSNQGVVWYKTPYTSGPTGTEHKLYFETRDEALAFVASVEQHKSLVLSRDHRDCDAKSHNAMPWIPVWVAIDDQDWEFGGKWNAEVLRMISEETAHLEPKG